MRMHPATHSATSAPVAPLALFALLVTLAALAPVAGAPSGEKALHPDTPAWTAPIFGPSMTAGGNAHGTIIVAEGQIIAWSLTGNRTQTSCVNGTPNTCGGHIDLDGEAVIAWDTDHTERFDVDHRNVTVLSARVIPPPLWPGFIVSLLAGLGMLGTALVAVGWIRERRMTGYLVRRLYEETKGQMPQDWPEALRHQWIARAFVRGKN